MSSYNTNKIIEKIMEKTDSKKIIWKTYNIENDKNPYSRKYFSTIDGLKIMNGYFSDYFSGRLFLIPDSDNKLYLFIQAQNDFIPFSFITPGPLDKELDQLYEKVKSSFNPIDAFLNPILS